MTVRNDYQVQSESWEAHYPVTKTRLENATPTATQPAAVKSRTNGVQLTGTLLSSKTGDTQAVLDATPGKVYKHYVRNVLTYSGAAENTFGAINEGDPVYYDRSATMPTDVFLSTSPQDAAAANNPLFGYVVGLNDGDTFPKGGATASTQTVAVMQIGSGG